MFSARVLETHPTPRSHREQVVSTVAALVDCQQACLACADACLAEVQLDPLRACIRVNLDCADVCAAGAAVLARQTAADDALLRALLDVCAEACAACAEECGRHAHEHCRVCAEACRRCEQSCKDLSARLGGFLRVPPAGETTPLA